MKIAGSTSTPPMRPTLSREPWVVVERRVVIVDGVTVHYEFARRTMHDANGDPHEQVSVSMAWPRGIKIVGTDGFHCGMTDAALISQLRGAMTRR